MINRRSFLVRSGLVLGASTLPLPPDSSGQALADDLSDWTAVRDQFEFTRDWINMACLLLASHPKPVRDAIEKHRREFDLNPISYVEENFVAFEKATLEPAAEYMGVAPADISLTVSTTMGLGILYGGLTIRPDQEILATTHDHYMTDTSLRYRSQQSGAPYRQVTLYDDPATTTESEIVDAFERAIRTETRIIAVTYVHSSTGVKLPIRAMAEVVERANSGRSVEDRAIFCVDGVHGFGVENVTMEDLGCDFFVAGTHKWIFGPRGTGLVWGKPEAWEAASPTIPGNSPTALMTWLSGNDQSYIRNAEVFSPGGWQAYDHRWSVGEAFQFHMAIGKDRVESRIHEFATVMKEEMARMPHVKLYTPMAEELSSGLICFDVDGMTQNEVIATLHDRGILAGATPYQVSYARVTPGLLNSEAEIETTLSVIRELST